MNNSRLYLNQFQIKLILVVFMVLDHVVEFIPGAPTWFTLLGRLVFPCFLYFVVDGVFYTSNRIAYLKRLFISAAIMAIGNTIVFGLTRALIVNNIFLSMAISVCIMLCFEKIKSKTNIAIYILLLIPIFLFTIVFAEGSYLVVVLTIVFYFLRSHKLWMLAVYIAVSLTLTMGSGARWFGETQWFMVFATIPLMIYNGERGSNTKLAKKFFYWFYPAHIWILAIIGSIMGNVL
ncbi:hypothetical protein KW94_02230 [Clostridioides difficile]|nr:hypothetical protein KW94_02230 [Clostridioides difficile]